MPRTAPLQRTAAALATAAVAGLSAAPASAAWSSPFGIGASSFDAAPEVVVDGQGNATAVWVAHEESFVTSIVARRRPAGGPWGPAQVVEQGTGSRSVGVGGLDVEVDPVGRVTVAFVRGSKTLAASFVLATATAPPDGPFAAPVNVTPEGGEDIDGEANGPARPDLAVGGDGRLVLAWAHRVQRGLDTDTSRHFVRVAQRDPGSPGWNATIAELSSRLGKARSVHAAVGPQGETVVTWLQRCDTGADLGCLDTLTSSTAAAGGAFAAAQPVASVSQSSPGSQLVLDGTGTATAAWITTRPSDDRALVVTARRPAGGTWAEGPVLSERPLFGGVAETALAMAVAADGTVAVAWPELTDDFVSARPVVARRTSAGWQQPEDASGGAAPQQLGTVALAGNAAGRLVAVWNAQHGGSTTSIRAAVRRPAEGFAAPEVLTEVGLDTSQHVLRPAAGIAPDGHSHAVWDRSGVGPQASELAPASNAVDPGPAPPGADGEGPQVTITTPAMGQRFTQGQAVTADYACTDDVGVTLCQGDVADGARLDTSVVGEHSLTVVAKDAAGRTTTRKHGYVVDAPAVSTTTTTQPPVVAATPAPRPAAPTAAQGAQAARTALGGSTAKAVAGTPKAVPAATIAKAGVRLPVFTARPSTEVAVGLAGLIGPAAGNLIGTAAGNIIGQAAGNLIGPAAGNLISDNGLGVVAAGGANLRGGSTADASPFRAAAAKPKLALLAKGGTFLAKPGTGKVRVKLTKQGKAVLRKAFRRKGRQRVQLTYVLVLSQRGAGLPAVFGSRTITIRE